MQHPDEGTIHAWLDGELPEERANEIAAHTNDCPECSAKVAEARGLIAASTRILTALDDVPAGVIPGEAVPASAPIHVRHRRWYDRTDIRAAAAVLVVAGASFLVVSRDSGVTRETRTTTDRIQPSVPLAVGDSRAVAKSSVVPPQSLQKASAEATPPAAVTDEGASKASNKMSAAPRGVVRADDKVSTPAPTNEAASAQSVAPPMAAAVAGGLATGSDLSARRSVAAGGRAETSSGVVEGRIVDKSSGRSVDMAQVLVPGTTLNAYTDTAGHFSIINVPAGSHTLTVRRIGYQQQHVAIVVPYDAMVTANITMPPETMMLSEAVVTGVATASAVASHVTRVVSVDSTTTTRRTVYEIDKGVTVTLTESPVDTARLQGAFGALKTQNSGVRQSAASAPEQKTTTNSISWTDGGRHYELSGALPVETLQRLRGQIMQTRQ